MTAHWGIEDPAAAEGDEMAKQRAMLKAFHLLNRRLSIFTSLPIQKLDAMSLQRQLNDIGQMSRHDASA
jgi:arsenate reductase